MIKATLFGVYTFLEKYLGCRMYTPKVKIIPVRDTIILGNIDDREVPESNTGLFITRPHGMQNM